MPKRAAMPVHEVTRCGQALAFKHLDVEVNAVKVAFFREALIEAWKWPWRDRERFDGSIWDEVYHGISQHFSTYFWLFIKRIVLRFALNEGSNSCGGVFS